MKNRQITVVAGLGALAIMVALGFLTSVRAQPVAAPKPTVMGIVDITRIERDLKEVQSLNADLQMRHAAPENEVKRRNEELKQKQDDLDLFNNNPAERDKRIAAIKHDIIELRVWGEVEQSDMAAQLARQHEMLYRKIISTVGQVARENGVDMVVMKEPEINLAGATREQVPGQILIRKLLWSGENVPGLTQRVIARMDNDFNNPPGSPPGSAAAPAPAGSQPAAK